MIFGVGTDIVAIERLTRMLERHGERAIERILAVEERDACRNSSEPGRFLAKRFAAKEALAKALGTGIRTPVLLPAIAVIHDELGKPHYKLASDLAAYMAEQGLTAHLSLSDERDCALAFAVVEKR